MPHKDLMKMDTSGSLPQTGQISTEQLALRQIGLSWKIDSNPRDFMEMVCMLSR